MCSSSLETFEYSLSLAFYLNCANACVLGNCTFTVDQKRTFRKLANCTICGPNVNISSTGSPELYYHCSFRMTNNLGGGGAGGGKQTPEVGWVVLGVWGSGSGRAFGEED